MPQNISIYTAHTQTKIDFEPIQKNYLRRGKQAVQTEEAANVIVCKHAKKTTQKPALDSSLFQKRRIE